ncbi:MAG: hypothetical protein AAF335_00560 [Bacteroidota bacterium]
MRTIYYGYCIVFLILFSWVPSGGSTKDTVALQLLKRSEADGHLSSIEIPTNESPKNLTFAALKEKVFIKAQKEKDPEYEDYKLKIFVRQKKKGTDIYQEKRIRFPKYNPIRLWYEKAENGEGKSLTVIFQEKLRKADITLVDRIDPKRTTYKGVYHFREKLVDIKDDFLKRSKAKNPAYATFQKDEIEIAYYLMYIDKTFKVDETLTVGQFTRKFAITGGRPLFFLYFSRKQITHPTPLPSPHPPATPTPEPNPPLTSKEIEESIAQAEPVHKVATPTHLISQPTPTPQTSPSSSSLPYIIFIMFFLCYFRKSFSVKLPFQKKVDLSTTKPTRSY